MVKEKIAKVPLLALRYSGAELAYDSLVTLRSYISVMYVQKVLYLGKLGM